MGVRWRRPISQLEEDSVLQWDKVKNILLVILLLVDGFLAVSIGGRFWTTARQQKDFAEEMTIVLARRGVIYNLEHGVAPQNSILPLEVDRDRTAEENFARALLTGEISAHSTEDGEARFTGDNGSVVWQTDGTVEVTVSGFEDLTDSSARKRKQYARELLKRSGIALRGGTLTARENTSDVVLRATVASMPAFDRALTVGFQKDGRISITGKWTFGTPYAATSDEPRIYSVADALLDFVAQANGVTRIDDIRLGYQLVLGSSGRLQFAPHWRIQTDRGVYFVDALKKTVTQSANIVDSE